MTALSAMMEGPGQTLIVLEDALVFVNAARRGLVSEAAADSGTEGRNPTRDRHHRARCLGFRQQLA